MIQDVYPNNKSCIRKDICTPMFTAALFTVTKTWKQPKCLAIEDWRSMMWYTYTMEYYSPVRMDEILPFATIWMDLENTMLTETS